ncbi:exocyst subunit SEC10 [Sporobolomyces salmoneus]|uniref:exocyst subunit SEC10 n=1 Tax=Sporobolomyces salmoneus TaxID=183962 RepID=UPI00316E2709
MGDRPPLPPQPPTKANSAGGGEEEKISLSTFQSSSFDVSQFVTQLMSKDVTLAKSKSGTFDPTPHIQTLEKTLAQLLPLRKQNALKTQELERQVNQAERAYRGDVRGAKAGFETVNSQFQTLDNKITSVGRTAVRIGEQLESIDRLRQRASEAHDLILYYNEFSSTSSNGEGNAGSARLEHMKREGGREGRHKVAVAARRLLSLSKEVDGLGGVENAERTRESIERYCERFEKEMLKLFDKYYRRGDPKAMAHCAQTLQDFNGGQSCIQIYVNQHDFFISKDRVQEIAGGLVGGAIWESLPDPNQPAPKSEPGLSNLYDEIRVTVGQEAQIVTAVFPNPSIVMQVFLQRVFAQVIQGYIETLIETASSSSTLAYLRILHLARAQTNSLVEDLKSHEFFRSLLLTSSANSSSSTSYQDYSSHSHSLSASGGPSLLNPLGSSTSNSLTITGGSGGGIGATGGGSSITQVSQMLDQSIEELFVPYMEGSRYLEKEGKSLTELYAGKLIRFTNWHRATNKAKSGNTIFDRMVTQLSNAAHQAHLSSSSSTTTLSSAATNPSTLGPGLSNPSNSTTSSSTNEFQSQQDSSRLDRLMKFSGLSNITTSSSSPTIGSHEENVTGGGTPTGNGGTMKMFEEGDGELNLEVAERMLEWHAEAIGRMVELSPAGDVPKNAFTLLKVLADSFGKAYLETSLDTAIHRLSFYDPKLEPSLSILRVLQPADMIMQLWQRYISTALVPLAGTSVTVRREMAIFCNHVSVRIEGKINSIVQRMTDGIVSYLTVLLSKQKKLDFKPKNDDLAFSRINTEPCLLVCDFLSKVKDVAEESLSGRNREVFLTEVGVTFHTLLLDHFKKFSISATGGLMLTKDLALYQDTISTFSLSPLNDRFEMLRQLGNVFIVQPEILRSYLNESYLARIENRLLRPFVMMRSDYGDFGRKFWDDIFGDTTPSTATTASTTGGDASNGALGFAKLGTLGNLSSLSSFGLANPSTQSTTTTTSNGVSNIGMATGGGDGSMARKQSLFGNLMRDFEGLGLKDDSTTSSEFGSKRGSMISGH